MTGRRAAAAKQGFGAAWLSKRLHDLLPNLRSVPIAVALSGGADSVALIAATTLLRRRGVAVRAIHVDHHLQPASTRFVEFCTTLCARIEVPLTVLPTRIGGTRGDSVEAAARVARYRAFASALQPGEVLLLGHHADDQLETVMLQLLRGAGVPGLAAMPETARCGRGLLVRPLLSVSRAALREFLSAQGLEPVEDPMNSDPRFDRNFLRLKVLPNLLERWPGAASAIGRSARHAAEAQRLLVAIGESDLAQIVDGGALNVAGLRTLDSARRRNALRVFIGRAGFPVPDTTRLNELAGPMLDARADAAPTIQWKGVVATRQMGRLQLRAADAVRAQRGDAACGTPIVWDWRSTRRIALGAGPGVLVLEDDSRGPLDLAQLPTQLRIDWRRGGERLRPRRGGPSRTLKALLHSSGVSHSDRAGLPLLYAGERLVAVADRWIDASIQALPSSTLRGRLSWTVRVGSDPAMC